MTNPNNSVGTNAGYNGRTTPNAFNDVLGIFDIPGIVSGWECSPRSGMTVQIGGGDVRDVAIAEDNAGNRVTINNRSGAPIDVTLPGAPATGNRYDVIVAYVNNPINGAGASDVDFPSQVGLIVVSGTTAANPNYPTDAQIEAAITADGGDGPNAYKVQLCSIFVGQGVTTIGSGSIEGGTESTIKEDLTLMSELRNEIISQRTTLFEGNQQGDTTLSDDWANYDEIEITFSTNSSGTQGTVQKFPGTATNITIQSAVAGGSNTAYLGYTRFSISGATMTRGNYYQKSIAASAITTQTQDRRHQIPGLGQKRTPQGVLFLWAQISPSVPSV